MKISGLGQFLQAMLALALFVVGSLVWTASASAASPLIDSESAGNITGEDATLEAEINPNGTYTAYEFQIYTEASFNYTQMVCPLAVPGFAQCMAIIVGEPLPDGLREPSQGSIPAGSSDQLASLDLAAINSTLQPGTTYYYRVIASNGANTVYGQTENFTTTTPSHSDPSIEAESVTGVTEHDATLRAQIDPHGALTAYEFQIDKTGNYDFPLRECPLPLPGYPICDPLGGGETLPPGLIEPAPESIASGSGTKFVSLDLASIGTTLEPNTTYHYRVIANNNGHNVDGSDQTFVTSSAATAPEHGKQSGTADDAEPSGGANGQLPAAESHLSAAPSHSKHHRRRHHRYKSDRAG
ncbi:MAG: hypothetical protein WB507_04200 [Solirubrobacterales bacterium]